MFNKTEIFRKQHSYNIYKIKPKLQKHHNFKKSLTNLKMNFLIINSNSPNNSNTNLKTSNSKLTLESASIRKVQTHSHGKFKKSLLDEKDKETDKTSRKISSTKKSHLIMNNFYNNCYSANIKKRVHKSRLHLKTQENQENDNYNNNKAYYLSGELPFRENYIIEAKKYKINTSNIITRNNKPSKNNNEFIQCKSFNNNNNYSYNTLKDKMLNMRKKDKEIDKLAKKLAIKLNSEDKKRYNQTKCGCGNLITLRNGFFNGVNLVMSYSPIRNKKKLTNKISKTDNNNNNNNKNNKQDIDNGPEFIYSDGYNFIPTNLPIFLRDKYNIKGTTVLSPFCIEARDEFLFKKIFYEDDKKKKIRREVIDNKLNIFYAENQKQYDKNLIKFNEKLKLKGRRVLHNVGPTPTEGKLNTIQNKMNFMKKIVDYAYPNMVLARVRESEKFYRNKNCKEFNLPPFKKVEMTNKQNNKYLGDYLRKSIIIQNH